MSFPDVEQPPLKKRRFFAEDTPPPEQDAFSTLPQAGDINALSASSCVELTNEPSSNGACTIQNQTGLVADVSIAGWSGNQSDGFDKQVIESFVGEPISSESLQTLKMMSENNVERAINMYLDGSWISTPSNFQSPSDMVTNSSIPGMPTRDVQGPTPPKVVDIPPSASRQLEQMPECRYVGAFGVGAWATRSGNGLVAHGDSVHVERTKIKPAVKMGRGGKPVQPAKGSVARMRTDIVVRFTNLKGEEVGRLPKETALWVSTLMDQEVCRFEGTCVFAPERVRVNDTIYLQLRCSLLKQAFDKRGFVKPANTNRTTGIFEEKETSEEKDLRLRQVSLVKLFDEVNLHPCTVNETTAKHKREGILQAAEIAEKYDKENDGKKTKVSQDGSSSPPAEDEAEDGKELEQDQLDSLYKKAQSFDFDTPTREPAEDFVMNLRRYQKQALHWMISKERDEKSENKEVSMHPLWEEYSWPTKDMDDQDLPLVAEQKSFYVNPYSGELSLEFPVQEQHCLGGILADGKDPEFGFAATANSSRNGLRKDD